MKKSMKVLVALFDLPGARPGIRDARKTQDFSWKFSVQHGLSYQASIYVRAIMGVLIHSGLCRAHAMKAIEKMFESKEKIVGRKHA